MYNAVHSDPDGETHFVSEQLTTLEKLLVIDADQVQQISEYLTALRRRFNTEIARRDRILHGVNTTCARFIRTSRWQDDINDILRILGEASDADRVGVFRFEQDTANRLRGSLVYAWDSRGIDLITNPTYQDFDVVERGFGPVHEHFEQGLPHYFHRSERPPDKILARDTETTLNIPVYVKSSLWGCFHFGMTREKREWTVPEVDTLQIAVDTMSAVIERQKTDEDLRHSEERLRQAVSLARIGIWDWNAATDQVTWNDEMFRIYGITREEFTGKGSDYIAFTRQDYRQQQIENIGTAFKHGVTERELQEAVPVNTQPHELVIVRPDGTECYTMGDAISVVDVDGKPLRMLGVTLDITERIRAEKAMSEHERMKIALEKEHELNTIKTNVMRTVSHEFRTPLAIILTSTSLLTRYYERLGEQERRDHLALIEKQVRGLDSMVGEIASVVHEMFDRHLFEPREVNLELLCQTNIAELQVTIGSTHTLIFSATDSLTSAWVDERLVHRILINLLSNAIKYSPVQSEIFLRLSSENNTAVIEVQDHGIGISEEDQKFLFEPFFRAGNVGKVSGTGLGLNILLDCVKRHSGSVSVSSTLGAGSTFTVRLPISPPQS